MSDDFGLSVRNPAMYQPTEADFKAKYPNHAHLENEQYNRLLGDYMGCVTAYL